MKVKILTFLGVFLIVSGCAFGQTKDDLQKQMASAGLNVKIERGDISELKGKKRVYVSSSSTVSYADNAALNQRITADLSELEVVKSAEDADFSVHFSVTANAVSPADSIKSAPASGRKDSSQQSQCRFLVLTRGEEQPDNSFALRILHERFIYSQDCRDEISRFIGGLIKKMKK